MSDEITYEKWEEYLNGDLDQQERDQLDAALQANEALQQELALYQEVRTAIQDDQLTTFQQTLQEVRQERNVSSPSANHPKLQVNYRWVTIAAAVVGLVVLAWLMLRQSNGELSDPAQLYAQYAQYEINLQEMSDAPELGIMQSLLQAKKYEEALPILNTYLADHPEAADIQLARAIALLETANTAAALQTLNKLESAHPIYANEAKWYRSLTYLKMGQLTEAQATLEKIPDTSSRYEGARELLQKIGR